jgi:hypothetical protein
LFRSIESRFTIRVLSPKVTYDNLLVERVDDGRGPRSSSIGGSAEVYEASILAGLRISLPLRLYSEGCGSSGNYNVQGLGFPLEELFDGSELKESRKSR